MDRGKALGNVEDWDTLLGAGWTTSWSSGCGDRSNTNASTSMPLTQAARQEWGLVIGSATTTPIDPTRLSAAERPTEAHATPANEEKLAAQLNPESNLAKPPNCKAGHHTISRNYVHRIEFSTSQSQSPRCTPCKNGHCFQKCSACSTNPPGLLGDGIHLGSVTLLNVQQRAEHIRVHV